MTEPEFAPEYSRAERWRILAPLLGLVLAAGLGLQFYGLPALGEFLTAVPCREWRGQPLILWVLSSLFIGMPLSVALLTILLAGPVCMRAWRSGQFPPPGQKVFKPTRIRRGRAAQAISLIPLVAVLGMLGMAAVGYGQAQVVAATFAPASQQGGGVPDCSPDRAAAEPAEWAD